MRLALAYSGAVVGLAVIALVSTAARSAPEPLPSTGRAHASGAELQCHHARAMVPLYRQRTWHWQEMRSSGYADRTPIVRGKSCHWARYAVKEWAARAEVARQSYKRWWRYEYDWAAWLPDKWQRIGACETGYGRRPGNWQHNSGTFEGAFGFYYGTWDAYRPSGAPSRADLATPRQQYQAALNVYAAHGYGAWGCGGA